MNLRVGFLLCGDFGGSVWQRWDMSSCPTARFLLQLKDICCCCLEIIQREKSPSTHSFFRWALIKHCVGCSVSLQSGRRRRIWCPLALILEASLWLHGVRKYTFPSVWETFEVLGNVLCFLCFSQTISFLFSFFFLGSLSLCWRRRRS